MKNIKLNFLKDVFPNSDIQYNMPILNYTVDCFIPEGHIIIEYDKEIDEKRIIEIRKEIMHRIVEGIPIYKDEKDICSNEWLKGKDILHVIKIKKGEEFKGLNEILNIMWEDSVIEHAI